MSRPYFSQATKTPPDSAARFTKLIEIAAGDIPNNVPNPQITEATINSITSRESGGTVASKASAKRFRSTRATAEKIKRGTMVAIAMM